MVTSLPGGEIMIKARDSWYVRLVTQEITMFRSIGYVSQDQLDSIIRIRDFNKEEVDSLMEGISDMEVLTSKSLIEYMDIKREMERLEDKLRELGERRGLVLHSLSQDEVGMIRRDCRKPYKKMEKL